MKQSVRNSMVGGDVVPSAAKINTIASRCGRKAHLEAQKLFFALPAPAFDRITGPPETQTAPGATGAESKSVAWTVLDSAREKTGKERRRSFAAYANPRAASIPILAVLTGDDTCTAECGLTVTSNTPVLELCRRLVAAGADPARPLHVSRCSILALTVASIGEGARLELNSAGTGFTRYRALRAAMAQDACPDMEEGNDTPA